MSKKRREPQLKNRLRLILAGRAYNGDPVEQKQISRDTGIAESTISRIVNNPDASASPRVVALLLDYLDIKIEEFYEFIPSESSDEGQWAAYALRN